MPGKTACNYFFCIVLGSCKYKSFIQIICKLFNYGHAIKTDLIKTTFSTNENMCFGFYFISTIHSQIHFCLLELDSITWFKCHRQKINKYFRKYDVFLYNKYYIV